MFDVYQIMLISRLSVFILIPLLIFCSLISRAQITAGFSSNLAGGCSPLTVSFTNTTTGASASATYTWDFGNGNQVTTADAQMPVGATYSVPQSYTVTLTVSDGSATSVATRVVTVYNNPVASFTGNLTRGCAPLSVVFTSASSPGTGSLSAYFWDFGDGHTMTSPTDTVIHVYTFAQDPGVSLTVTNSYGCTSTVTESALIHVQEGYQPAFTADSTLLCVITDPVQFTNTTLAPATVVYTWAFGDGTGSGVTSPAHTYSQKGTYDVSLIATATDGCSDTITQNAFVHAADYQLQIRVPSPLCSEDSVVLSDTSEPWASRVSWLFGDDNSVAAGDTVTHLFKTGGTFPVTVTGQFGQCLASDVSNITVLPSPALKGFVTSYDTLCGDNGLVTFQDTLAGVVSRTWYYDSTLAGEDPINSTAASTTANYAGPLNLTDSAQQVSVYYPVLSVTAANGCKATVVKPISIAPPIVAVRVFLNGVPENIYDYYVYACASTSFQFKATGMDSIVQYTWTFGDGAYSSDSTPTHTYAQPGTYTVILAYTTLHACTSSRAYYVITTYQTPEASFTISPGDTVCGNTPVVMTPNPGLPGWNWNYGDGYSDDDIYGQHEYKQSGTFTVRLISSSGTGCSDTVTHQITVLGNFPDIYNVAQTCDGDRGGGHLYGQRKTDNRLDMEFWGWNVG
jgi:PKD repeat protein